MPRDHRVRSSPLVTPEEGARPQTRPDVHNTWPRHSVNPHVKLTDRELQVLALVAEGKSNKEIARALIISPSTAKAHVSSLIHKLGVESRIDAAVIWTKWSQC